MIAALLILLFTAYLAFFLPLEKKEKPEPEHSETYNKQMKVLWKVAKDSMKEKKPARAEKALLTILKFDEKNAAAYNRLGILYAKSEKYDEAIECFEIAESLDNNPAAFHNVGLIYLETGAFEKAVLALRQAIELEGDVPARFIALSKAEEQLGNYKKAIDALENAYELDPKVSTLRQILAIYELENDEEGIAATSARIETELARVAAAKAKKTKRVRSRGARAVASKNATKTTSAKVATPKA